MVEHAGWDLRALPDPQGQAAFDLICAHLPLQFA